MMPQPDDVTSLPDEVIRLWREAQDRINARAAQIIGDGEQIMRWREMRRLETLVEVAETEIRAVEGITREWLIRDFPRAYGAGAADAGNRSGRVFGWTEPHRVAIQTIANDTFTDLLARTGLVPAGVRATIRDLARTQTGVKVATGQTAVQAGRELRRQLLDRGIATVTYRNGARVGVAQYSEMVLRTKTAMAYNAGTLNFATEVGVPVVEVFDGLECGWEEHNDPRLANGLIVSVAAARDFPVSHPNCVRSFGPRPDLTMLDTGEIMPSTSQAQRDDQAAFEQELPGRTRRRRYAPTVRGARRARQPVRTR